MTWRSRDHSCFACILSELQIFCLCYVNHMGILVFGKKMLQLYMCALEKSIFDYLRYAGTADLQYARNALTEF